jgi:Na+-driven multidrug efflux pump
MTLASVLYCSTFYSDEMLLLLRQRAIMQPAKEFFIHNNQRTVSSSLYDGNNVIRAEGKAKFAMMAMIIPLLSILFRYSFIYMNLGMFGAAATAISYTTRFFVCTGFCI